MRVLITGAAGFIGYHVSSRLLSRGDEVIAVDNLNDYHPVGLKVARLAHLLGTPKFQFHKVDITDQPAIASLFASADVDAVVHLAAQEGVRYSLEDPRASSDINIVGFLNTLEGCRHARVRHLVFASSDAVYGANTKLPFSTHDHVDHPVSVYAATKRSNELLAHCYSHLYGLPVTGLRLFTVYGPWGNPDTVAVLFTRNILEGRPIDVFNNGAIFRDFTYIDDVVESVVRVLDAPPRPDAMWRAEAPNPGASYAPYRIHNIGTNEPTSVLRFIEVLERALGRKAEKNLLPMQPGDVMASFADVDDLADAFDFRPTTLIEVGLSRFLTWYRSYYGPPLNFPVELAALPADSTA